MGEAAREIYPGNPWNHGFSCDRCKKIVRRGDSGVFYNDLGNEFCSETCALKGATRARRGR